MTFCGFEIKQDSSGIRVGQAAYVQSFLDKYPEISGTTSCPYAKKAEVDREASSHSGFGWRTSLGGHEDSPRLSVWGE